jgi:hypothetical protein
MLGYGNIYIPAPSSDIIWLIIGIFVGVPISALALILAELGVNHYYCPILEIDRKESPISRSVHFSSGKFGKIGEVELDRILYTVNRIRVNNKGRRAAEDCKIALITKNSHERICWSVPSERYTMTINAHDSEYFDLCAYSNVDPSQLMRGQKAGVNVKADKEMTRGATLFEGDVLHRIAPTEEGWKPIINSNRDLKHTDLECAIYISSKNSKGCREQIRILEHPVNDSIVEFMNEWLHDI